MELLPNKKDFKISYEEEQLSRYIDPTGLCGNLNTLLCPHCSEDYLHHYGFTIYDRDEDERILQVVDAGEVMFEKDGTFAVVLGRDNAAGKGLVVKEELDSGRNPSSRRGGIVVKFWCETCHRISLLTIAQHKGSSYIGWRKISAVLQQKKRKTIKPGLRFDVLKRDNYTCQACGATPQSGAVLEVDHIKPFSKGGTDDISNLQVLCRECNLGKGNKEQ